MLSQSLERRNSCPWPGDLVLCRSTLKLSTYSIHTAKDECNTAQRSTGNYSSSTDKRKKVNSAENEIMELCYNFKKSLCVNYQLLVCSELLYLLNRAVLHITTTKMSL